MLKRILATVLVLGVLVQPAKADDWFSQDKALHFGASAGIAALLYHNPAPLTRDERLWTSVGITLMIGAAKELIWDADGNGDPSAKDMTWNAIGAFTGVLAAFLLDVATHPYNAPMVLAPPSDAPAEPAWEDRDPWADDNPAWDLYNPERCARKGDTRRHNSPALLP